ncbi:hypothetical protein [Wolbachia endosymbiont (group A) of Trypoxylon clavicerum]|uniref:hypothetical protein n=1 Tax=Wolbachia endosymbiont (group A) of Trypoxylon clavicerum TaxID=2954064 RepID=UPI002230C451|nr:hypothetical protein [Wolbachia endosymbiont (group A) of Trypoxylon clavicerum]
MASLKFCPQSLALYFLLLVLCFEVTALHQYIQLRSSDSFCYTLNLLEQTYMDQKITFLYFSR